MSLDSYFTGLEFLFNYYFHSTVYVDHTAVNDSIEGFIKYIFESTIEKLTSLCKIKTSKVN